MELMEAMWSTLLVLSFFPPKPNHILFGLLYCMSGGLAGLALNTTPNFCGT